MITAIFLCSFYSISPYGYNNWMHLIKPEDVHTRRYVRQEMIDNGCWKWKPITYDYC